MSRPIWRGLESTRTGRRWPKGAAGHRSRTDFFDERVQRACDVGPRQRTSASPRGGFGGAPSKGGSKGGCSHGFFGSHLRRLVEDARKEVLVSSTSSGGRATGWEHAGHTALGRLNMEWMRAGFLFLDRTEFPKDRRPPRTLGIANRGS